MSTMFEFTVPADGMFILPEEFRGKNVNVTVRSLAKRSNPNKPIEECAIYALEGILKGYTHEDLEKAKEEYLTEKYCHD